MWTFRGKRNITKAYKILAKYKISYTVVDYGEEWLNKRSYLEAHLHINTDTSSMYYDALKRELIKCKDY